MTRCRIDERHPFLDREYYNAALVSNMTYPICCSNECFTHEWYVESLRFCDWHNISQVSPLLKKANEERRGGGLHHVSAAVSGTFRNRTDGGGERSLESLLSLSDSLRRPRRWSRSLPYQTPILPICWTADQDHRLALAFPYLYNPPPNLSHHPF